MKIRDSGMPNEHTWQSFFEAEMILTTLGLDKRTQNIVDFGCGYGTFALAATKLASGNIYALDIDENVLEVARNNAIQQGLGNVDFLKQDFMSEGTGLDSNSMDFAMMFNLLHMENPELLLMEAHRILKPDGKLAIMHWNYDADTPRGPAMSIHPKPEQIIGWARSAGFASDDTNIIDLPPYHYDLVLSKTPLVGTGLTKRSTLNPYSQVA